MTSPLGRHIIGRLVALEDELVAFRRELHRHPEPAFEEVRTTSLLVARLRRAGLAPRVLPEGTGVVCDIVPRVPRSRGAVGDRGFVALRSDIDALPVQDTKSVAYRSNVPGVSHACGHDVHTAALLGAGLVLAELAEAGELATPVRLLFQPGEEVLPGGALRAIAAGVLADVDAMFAQHCDPAVEVGRIALLDGPITSGQDEFVLTAEGRGGHSSRPHLTEDLVHAMSGMMSALPHVVRRFAPQDGLVFTWTLVRAGEALNVIPTRGTLGGSLRTMNPTAWERIPEALADQFEGAARAGDGVRWTFDLSRRPPVVNTVVDGSRAAVLDLFGTEAVAETQQSLGGEDFAWYLSGTRGVPEVPDTLGVPGNLARLGVRPRGTDAESFAHLHQGRFDVAEEAIGVGAAYLARMGAGSPDDPAVAGDSASSPNRLSVVAGQGPAPGLDRRRRR